jgi:hypothetical protein
MRKGYFTRIILRLELKFRIGGGGDSRGGGGDGLQALQRGRHALHARRHRGGRGGDVVNSRAWARGPRRRSTGQVEASASTPPCRLGPSSGYRQPTRQVRRQSLPTPVDVLATGRGADAYPARGRQKLCPSGPVDHNNCNVYC